jgi:hypothetical protein
MSSWLCTFYREGQPMRLNIILLVLFIFTLATHVFGVKAVEANAFLELSPSTGQIQSTGSSIEVKVNSGNNYLKSATAVISYDHTKASITITEGTFFSVVTTDVSTPGEIKITGTLSLGDTVGVTGIGTLATINITPTVTDGLLAPTFRCSEAQTNDSNIINMEDVNLLATTAQCGNNVGGNYTIGTATGATTDATESAVTTQTTVLPQAGSNDVVVYALGGLFFIVAAIWTTWTFSKAKEFGED